MKCAFRNGHPNPGDGEGDLPREAVPATQPQPAPAEAGEQGGEAGQEVPLPVPGQFDKSCTNCRVEQRA